MKYLSIKVRVIIKYITLLLEKMDLQLPTKLLYWIDIDKLNQTGLSYNSHPEALKILRENPEKINWDGLLNFIPLGLLFGQRPAVWWAKKHDIDLLLGIFKYGYAKQSRYGI